MADKTLRKLRKPELLKLLIDISRENRQLTEELQQVRAELDDRKLRIEDCGSIADAALKLTEVFAEAQKAIDLYRENVERECQEKIAEAQRQADEIIARAEQGRKEIGQ